MQRKNGVCESYQQQMSWVGSEDGRILTISLPDFRSAQSSSSSSGKRRHCCKNQDPAFDPEQSKYGRKCVVCLNRYLLSCCTAQGLTRWV
eukprot:764786-Hanusia_phi.AAC.6